MNHHYRMLWSFTLALIAAGCGGGGPDPIVELTVSPTTAVVGRTREIQLFVSTITQSGRIALVKASDSTNVTWSSTNTAVATVVRSAGQPVSSGPNDFSLGVVTGVGTGTTDITATFNGLSDTVPVVVPTLQTQGDLTLDPSLPADPPEPAQPSVPGPITLVLPRQPQNPNDPPPPPPTRAVSISAPHENPTATIAITPFFNLTSSDPNVATVALEAATLNGLSTPPSRFIVTGRGVGTAMISGSYLSFPPVTWTVTVDPPAP